MIGTGQNLAEDNQGGFFNRLQLTPIHPAALVAGQLAGTLTLGLFQAATYISVGLLAGAHIEAGFAGALVMVALAICICLAFGSIGLAVGMRVDAPEKVQSLFPLIFVFLFLSSMSLPRNLIQTDWFREVATYNPVSYMVEGLRSLLITGWDGEALALGFGCALGILAIGLFFASTRPQGEDGPHMRRYLSVAGGLAWRLLHSLVTNPLLFLPPMLMPLFFFTAFAGGLSAVSNVPGFDYGPGYTSFIFAFVLCQSAAFGGVFSGFSIAADFQFGFGRRLLLATPHRSALILGYGAVAVIRAAITITAVTLVGLLVGMNIGGNGLDLFGMYALAAIINVTGLLFAAGVALRFRSLQATPLMQVPVFLFLFLAPVYVPRELLGGWVHAVAPFNPATHVMETVRDLIAGNGHRVPGDARHHRRSARRGDHLHVPRPAPGRGRRLAAGGDPRDRLAAWRRR